MRRPEAPRRKRALKYTDEELLNALVKQAQELGRTPASRETTYDEWNYRNRFGSYNAAVVAAGLKPNVMLPQRYIDGQQEKVPLSRRFKVLRRDGFTCQYCGGTPQDGYVLHVDHVVPRSLGGTAEETNLITACWACNLGKGAS